MIKKTEGKAEAGISARRKFLTGAAAATTGAAIVGFPMIAKAQAGPINMRWQSTWPAKDIFHEYALDFAKKVNDMTGGDLKIEVLPAGAVVPAFGLLDAVSKGTLDGGHGVMVYHYGKQNALALWAQGLPLVWMPTCSCLGINMVVVKSCCINCMHQLALTSCPTPMAQCPHSH